MDVWVEFNLAVREQMSEMFRSFFPASESAEESAQEEIKVEKTEADEVKFDITVQQIPENKGEATSAPPPSSTSPSSSLWSTFMSYTSQPAPPTPSARPKRKQRKAKAPIAISSQHIKGAAHQPPLSPKALHELSEMFAKKVPEGMFSMAEIQGFLLKFKGRPEEAVDNAVAWVEEEQQRRGKEVVKDKESDDSKEEEESESEEAEAEGEADDADSASEI